MGIFSRKKRNTNNTAACACVQTGSLNSHPYSLINSSTPLCGMYGEVYRAMKEGVPIIDSAVNKIVRLMGGFKFSSGNETLDAQINEFFSLINVGSNQTGINSFVDTYLNQLLTYGSAVGEMIYDDSGFYALYNGDLRALEVKRKENSLELEFYNTSGGTPKLIKKPQKLLFSVLNPEPSAVEGTSLLRGLPFMSDILLKIFNTIGTNWERVGNLRYAVTYNPKSDAQGAFAQERAKQMANSWREAMSSSDSIKDFVAVGDVKVSVIGADNQILDSEVPVRQILEQIIAKTGLMPYMFGLNWSTSERMAKQQTDILTTELKAYRRIITPVLKKIGNTYLALGGRGESVDIIWDDITLQDETQTAQARLYNAEADKILTEVGNAES